MAVEPSVVEAWEEHAQDTYSTLFGLVKQVWKIVGGHQVVSRIAETGCDYGHHGCSTDNGIRNQAK